MYEPAPLNAGAVVSGTWDMTGVEPNEPYTAAGSGACPTHYETFTLTKTNWYAFTGTGGRMIVELNGYVREPVHFGMVLYAAEDVPTAADELNCTPYVMWQTMRFDFNSVEGQRYLIQVGDPTDLDDIESPTDQYQLMVGTPAPNDEIGDAIDLPLDQQTHISNIGATLAPGEPFECPREWWPDPDRGDHSVWLRVDAPSTGTLQLQLRSQTTPQLANGWLGLFAADGAPRLGCAVQNGDEATLEADVTKGPYYVQVMSSGWELTYTNYWLVNAHFTPDLDIDADGIQRPTDCDDNDAAIRPGALDLPEDGVDQDCSGADAVNFDRDGDTFQRPGDCNDRNARIHPGAKEVPDDGIDQNCDGRDNHRDTDRDGVPDVKDRCPHRSSGGIDGDGNGCRDPIQLDITANVTGYDAGDHLLIERIDVRSAPGASVVIACSRHACTRSAKRLRRSSIASWTGIFAARVPPGTIITVAATKPHAIGMVKRYRLTAHGKRLVGIWCTPVGKPHKRIRCA